MGSSPIGSFYRIGLSFYEILFVKTTALFFVFYLLSFLRFGGGIRVFVVILIGVTSIFTKSDIKLQNFRRVT